MFYAIQAKYISINFLSYKEFTFPMLINFFLFAKILKMVPTVFANNSWVVNGQSLYSLQLSAFHNHFSKMQWKNFLM